MSINAAGTQTANEASLDPVFSPDGTKVAFTSFASDLGATDTNGTSDIYLRDLATGVTTLVSVNVAGTQAGNGWSGSAVFSPDGTKVAFASKATDLGPTDTNSAADIYLRDLTTGTTELVSATSDGAAGTAQDGRVVFSSDGTKVAFASDGSLVPDYEWRTTDPRGGLTDVFVRDLTAGTTDLVSVDINGNKTGNDSSYSPTFSPDGTRIAFISRASDLVTNSTPAWEDLYVRDLGAQTTSLASVDLAGIGAGAAAPSRSRHFSPDGATLYFTSQGTNMVTTPDGNGTGGDIFARDLTTGITTLISTNEAGTASGNGGSAIVALSADGSKMLLSSGASDLGPTDTNGLGDIYMKDLLTGATSLVSVAAGGDDSGNAVSHALGMSPDGSKVVFTSFATNLGPPDSDGNNMPEPAGDDTGNQDVYVRDVVTGRTAMVSTNAGGTDSANGTSTTAVLSPDGSRVAFETYGTDLGYTDWNEGPRGTLSDIYVASFHGADLSITVDADRATVPLGGTITYHLAVANAGPDAASAVKVGVLLPEQSELVGVEATGATCTSPDPASPNVLVCDAGALPPGAGADATITVTATAGAPATLSLVAVTASDTADPDGTDNAAQLAVSAADVVA